MMQVGFRAPHRSHGRVNAEATGKPEARLYVFGWILAASASDSDPSDVRHPRKYGKPAPEQTHPAAKTDTPPIVNSTVTIPSPHCPARHEPAKSLVPPPSRTRMGA